MNAADAAESLAIAQAQREARQRMATLAWSVRRVMARGWRVVVSRAVAPGQDEQHTGYIVECRREPEGLFITLAEKPSAIDRGEEVARIDLADISKITKAAA